MGAGQNAQTLARLLLATGHEVALSNARGPESLSGVVAALGAGAHAGGRADAVAADLKILAVNSAHVRAAGGGVGAGHAPGQVDGPMAWMRTTCARARD